MLDDFLIVILAAGASRRMGQPKQLLEIDGERLIHRQCRVALEAKLGSVGVVLGCQHESCAQAIADLPIHQIENIDWSEGMAASVRAAAYFASERQASGLMIFLVDQYLLQREDLQALGTAWQNNPSLVAISVSDGYRGPPVIFPAEYFGKLLDLQGDQGARKILQQLSPMEMVAMNIVRASEDWDTPDGNGG